MHIRDTTPQDFAAILRLNLEFERFLSPLNATRLELLHSQASYHRVVAFKGEVVAFLMAHCQGTGYDSDNYAWFHQRYAKFTYIDRVVVATSVQGMGVGKQLYTDLFTWVQQQNSSCVGLEFDINPPNLGSEQFHAKLGFSSVGVHTSTSSGKQVNMQIKHVSVL